ncbi:MAG: trypsin-like peptidase domain-containing protein [Fuerstiella sp.]|nr:trypsin-like peptidase domain-containing protein [Fuerstiella sp.]
MSASLARFFFFNAVIFTCVSVPAAEEISIRETPLVRAVRDCRGAVVNIHTEKSAEGERENRFFASKERKVSGMGTGIVVDERGYIVTNCHVIYDVDLIIVTQEDGETYTGRVFQTDKAHDLAIIRVFPSKPMKVMDIGTSSDVMLAEQVFAVGNAFGYEHTVTAGIVSAVSRDVEVDETQSYKDLIQTDASINPGNSGGPLLNLDGEVIGINVAIRAGAQRIGFAIPIDDARQVIARMLNSGGRHPIDHGLVGTDINLSYDQHLVIDTVIAGSPADQCGLKAGDIVRQVEEISITDNADWERSLLDLRPDTKLNLKVDRDGESVDLQFMTRHAGTGTTHVTARPASGSGRAAIQTGEQQGLAETHGSDMAWKYFGIKLADLSASDLKLLPSRYNGGMKVLFVQSDSAGARYGLRNGDILVGLDGYETLGEQNLSFVLNQSRLQIMDEISFQIVRNGNEALVGSIRLKNNQRRSAMNHRAFRR